MKKIIFFSIYFLVFSGIHADQGQLDIEQVKKEANIITFKVTVYHDKEYDKERWEKIVDDATQAIDKGRTSSDENRPDVIVDAFVRSIERAYQSRGTADGIHGEMTISVSDGQCDVTRCGKQCDCTRKYGACPCAAEDGYNPSCCKMKECKERNLE